MMQQIVYDSCTLSYSSQFTEAVTKRTLLCKGTVVFFINSFPFLNFFKINILKFSCSWRYAVCEISHHSDTVLSVSWHKQFGIHFRPLWEMALSNRENFISTETSFSMRERQRNTERLKHSQLDLYCPRTRNQSAITVIVYNTYTG